MLGGVPGFARKNFGVMCPNQAGRKSIIYDDGPVRCCVDCSFIFCCLVSSVVVCVVIVIVVVIIISDAMIIVIVIVVMKLSVVCVLSVVCMLC